MNLRPPPLPSPTPIAKEPPFLVAVAGRFSLFFLWLLPSVVAVCLYYALIVVVLIMGYSVVGKIDPTKLLLVAIVAFGGLYIPALLILTKITSGITRIRRSPGSRKKWRFSIPYFLVNLVLGPVVLWVWWFVTQRM